MNLMRQIFIVTLLNFRSLPQRAWSSLVIVVGMAVVIGVLLSMLSLTAGMVRAYQGAGDAGRAIVLASGAPFEFGSAIPRSSVTTILNAPGIRKDANGRPLADAEVLVHVPATRIATGLPAIVLLRGFGPQGARLRPEFALVSGRMFRPGRREMLAGVGAQGQFADLHIGDRVILPDGPWPIVGIFTTKGDIVEGGLVADTDTVMSATRHTTYNSVIARLETPAAFDVFKAALTTNPALSVTVERHSDYYRRSAGQFAAFFDTVAYAIGIIMAVGALFGAVNTMYTAVSARTREIGTLRALGFSAVAVSVSVILEAVALALAGAAIGAAVAWLLFDGRQGFYNSNVFDLSVTPGLMGLGAAWATGIAILGGLFPALRAARLPIVAALRAA